MLFTNPLAGMMGVPQPTPGPFTVARPTALGPAQPTGQPVQPLIPAAFSPPAPTTAPPTVPMTPPPMPPMEAPQQEAAIDPMMMMALRGDQEGILSRLSGPQGMGIPGFERGGTPVPTAAPPGSTDLGAAMPWLSGPQYGPTADIGSAIPAPPPVGPTADIGSAFKNNPMMGPLGSLATGGFKSLFNNPSTNIGLFKNILGLFG